jgi:hypothetical protein
MIELSLTNPPLESVLLNANLETVWIILVLGQKRGRE